VIGDWADAGMLWNVAAVEVSAAAASIPGNIGAKEVKANPLLSSNPVDSSAACCSVSFNIPGDVDTAGAAGVPMDVDVNLLSKRGEEREEEHEGVNTCLKAVLTSNMATIRKIIHINVL
jgi:hypothetical protein